MSPDWRFLKYCLWCTHWCTSFINRIHFLFTYLLVFPKYTFCFTFSAFCITSSNLARLYGFHSCAGTFCRIDRNVLRITHQRQAGNSNSCSVNTPDNQFDRVWFSKFKWIWDQFERAMTSECLILQESAEDIIGWLWPKRPRLKI